MSDRLYGLPPVIDERARVLILGSFPSEASLAAQHYYGHPQNQFWRILAEVLGVPLAQMDYAAKLAAARAAGLAIWDVYGRCAREGSLDSAIRDVQPNAFGKLKQIAPQLRRVCFNGKTAGKFAGQLQSLGFETSVLPSTSPAYTLPFAAKLAAWRAALNP